MSYLHEFNLYCTNCKLVKPINEFEMVAGCIGKQFVLIEKDDVTALAQIDLLGKCSECWILYSHKQA